MANCSTELKTVIDSLHSDRSDLLSESQYIQNIRFKLVTVYFLLFVGLGYFFSILYSDRHNLYHLFLLNDWLSEALIISSAIGFLILSIIFQIRTQYYNDQLMLIWKSIDVVEWNLSCLYNINYKSRVRENFGGFKNIADLHTTNQLKLSYRFIGLWIYPLITSLLIFISSMTYFSERPFVIVEGDSRMKFYDSSYDGHKGIKFRDIEEYDLDENKNPIIKSFLVSAICFMFLLFVVPPTITFKEFFGVFLNRRLFLFAIPSSFVIVFVVFF